MKVSQEESGPGPERSGPDWIVVGVGVMTVGAAIATATALGASNAARESGNGNSELIAYLAVGAAVVSLGTFLMVVVTSLSTLFRRSPLDQEREIKRSAVGLYVQVFAAILFALLVIVGPFFARGQQDIDAGNDRRDCPSRSGSTPDGTRDTTQRSASCLSLR